MKKYNRDMLQFFVDRLEQPLLQHGLVYALIRGTLLGAVRHEGMIPFEQDLDITIDWDKSGYGGVDLGTSEGRAWLCTLLEGLVKRHGGGNFAVVCSGSQAATEQRMLHLRRMEQGRVPPCDLAMIVSNDPWYDTEVRGTAADTGIHTPVRIFHQTQAGELCMQQRLDLYYSRDFVSRLGPLCRCFWEGLPVWCPSDWDASLASTYGIDYWTPKLSQQTDMLPCPS